MAVLADAAGEVEVSGRARSESSRRPNTGIRQGVQGRLRHFQLQFHDPGGSLTPLYHERGRK